MDMAFRVSSFSLSKHILWQDTNSKIGKNTIKQFILIFVISLFRLFAYVCEYAAVNVEYVAVDEVGCG